MDARAVPAARPVDGLPEQRRRWWRPDGIRCGDGAFANASTAICSSPICLPWALT
ncbi:hypothetical protein MLP_35730 [Microlunatus phosphovorus NM-1]|uniref:Uncharacterized protein n=1 Tax=Microlunatus phosphovorus (strain ATCC 700054 / DSM 10555 / JCM 9379 / NBRC 101784 / NCIMB 13414 / VKM Ac-1990 / NM-1) TaxID=1032480 RepID=F5XND7_MICPN|nr:hypothetical protein MLP_35730 [Microlunatus phosphovorus NM-1]